MEFETLYQELEYGLTIIPTLVHGVTQVEAKVRPTPDSWSILEVICHLYDEEREDFREHLDQVLNRPGEKWSSIDPQGWVTSRNYNERNLAEMVDKFRGERRKSLNWLRGLSSPKWDANYMMPVGPLKAGDIFASWVAHDNLHVRQLVELRRARIVTITQPYDLRYAGEW